MQKLTIACGLMLAAALGAVSYDGPSGARYVALPAAHAQDAKEAKEATPEELAEAAYASLEKNCATCHGEGKRLNRKAPVDRASYQKLIDSKLVVPGKPDESELYTVMIDKDNPMPPAKVKDRPTPEEIEAIRVWIEKGAPAPKAAAQ